MYTRLVVRNTHMKVRRRSVAAITVVPVLRPGSQRLYKEEEQEVGVGAWYTVTRQHVRATRYCRCW